MRRARAWQVPWRTTFKKGTNVKGLENERKNFFEKKKLRTNYVVI